MMKTYGTATYNKATRNWVLEVEPHVAIRAKRWFAKIDTYQYGTLSISATPENSRDLSVFCERFPLIVQPWELLNERAQEHKDRQSLVSQLIANTATHAPFELKLPIREYQDTAVRMWLATRGLLIADDVGLGKSLEAIAGLTQPGTLPALVVTLTHLPQQWEEQINKFTDLTTYILRKGQPYDFLPHCGGKLPDVIITNYHKLSGWAETLAPIIKTFISDEVHEFRHDGTNKYRAAQWLCESAEYKVGLSATPIFNFGGEIWNVLNLLSPGALGTREEFNREWCVESNGKVKIKDPSAFGLYARESGLMLRRTRKDVKRELPEVTTVVHTVEADLEVLNSMKGQAIELAKIILAQGGEDFKGQRMSASGQFDLKMRQATGISKAPFVAEFIRMLIESSGEPVIVGLWHREVYSILMEKLKDFNPVMYSGSETPMQKERSKQKFLSGESQLMLLSLRSGAGMDGLQERCHVTVLAELDWSHSCLRQFIGRIHRDGQDDPVTAYYLLSDHGSDPIMADLLGVKRMQLDGILDPNPDDLLAELQMEEGYVKKMAERLLTTNNVKIPQTEDKIVSASAVLNETGETL